jgi:two-component system cell cycle response regulator
LTDGVALSASDGGDACLLLAEDDKSSADKIRAIVEKDGYDLQVASSRIDLIGQATSTPYDVLLISLDVADDDALRLCSQLRSNDETRHTPIVLLVDENDNNRLAKALELGVNDYLMRPVDRHELLARMRTQVRRKKYQDRLRANYRRSLSLAVTDGLTELYNRRYLATHLDAQVNHARRKGKPLAALMIDIDHFKKVNDTYGHACGDEVLRETARRISENVRSFDTVARYGGEEFAVVMPDTDPEAAAAVAERLRVMISATPVKVIEPAAIVPVTASIGIGTAEPGSEVSAGELLERADEALYAAKNGGRNQVCSVGEEGAPKRVNGEGLGRAH